MRRYLVGAIHISYQYIREPRTFCLSSATLQPEYYEQDALEGLWSKTGTHTHCICEYSNYSKKPYDCITLSGLEWDSIPESPMWIMTNNAKLL